MITVNKLIKYMKEYLERCLDELYEEKEANDFIYGEKTAFVECLELLQSVARSPATGLNYEVEEKYPLVNGQTVINYNNTFYKTL